MEKAYCEEAEPEVICNLPVQVGTRQYGEVAQRLKRTKICRNSCRTLHAGDVRQAVGAKSLPNGLSCSEMAKGRSGAEYDLCRSIAVAWYRNRAVWRRTRANY